MQCPACPCDIDIKQLKVMVCPNCGAKIKFKYRFWYTYFRFVLPVAMTHLVFVISIYLVLLYIPLAGLDWYVDRQQLFIKRLELVWDGKQFFLSDLIKVVLIAGVVLGFLLQVEDLDHKFKDHLILALIVSYGTIGILMAIFYWLDEKSHKTRAKNAAGV